MRLVDKHYTMTNVSQRDLAFDMEIATIADKIVEVFDKDDSILPCPQSSSVL